VTEVNERIEISVARMEVQVERLEKDMAEMKDDVKAIRATLDKASGGWKMLLVVGTISAAIGSFATKVMTLWPFGR
jgi:phage shock protein A